MLTLVGKKAIRQGHKIFFYNFHNNETKNTLELLPINQYLYIWDEIPATFKSNGRRHHMALAQSLENPYISDDIWNLISQHITLSRLYNQPYQMTFGTWFLNTQNFRNSTTNPIR